MGASGLSGGSQSASGQTTYGTGYSSGTGTTEESPTTDGSNSNSNTTPPDTTGGETTLPGTTSGTTDVTTATTTNDPTNQTTDATNQTTDPTNPAMCGNGAIDGNEQCDGANLNGFTCEALGNAGGTLQCDPVTCTFDTQLCEGGGGTSG